MKHQHKIKLPFILSIGSLIFIFSIMIFTNPVNNIIYVVLVFSLLLILMISLSLLFINLQSEGKHRQVAARNATLVSLGVVLLMMLRSANALNVLDLGLMLLFLGGVGFYISKRQK